MICLKKISELTGRTDMHFRVLVLLLFFFIVFSCIVFRADAEVFYSEGTYPVIGGKKFPAQRFAHTQAFTNAVSQAIETLVPRIKGNGKFDKSEILKGPFPFVRKEDLVERSIDSHDVMKIALRVDIDMDKLSARLGKEGVKFEEKKRSHTTPMPRLIIVFGEEIDGHVSKLPYSSQVMHDFLQERHFNVLLDDVIKKDVKNELAIQGMLRGDTREALNLAHHVGAVVVLSGKLTINSFNGSKDKTATYLASVSFQAINADTGRIIASVKHKIRHSCEKSDRGARECIAKATRETGVQLVQAIEKEFNVGKVKNR